MKNIIIVFLVFPAIAHCQQPLYIQPPALGIHLVFNDFTHTDSLKAPGRSGRLKTGLAMNYLKGITKYLDLNTTLAATFIDFPGKDPSGGGQHLFLEGDASIRAKLVAGKRRIIPFLQAGIGLSGFQGYYGLFVPAGIGLQLNLPGEAFLLLHSQYRIPVTDNQPGHIYYSIGVAGIIANKKKQRQRSLQLPAGKSPLIPPVLNPSTLDSDGDGIPDKDDKCPSVPGTARYQGCPVPDRDGDGVDDEQDKCPDLPGRKDNQGCPVVKSEVLRKIKTDAKNVFFETDSYTLLPSSYPALNEVAGILTKDPGLKMEIEGHTDSTGSAEMNQILSERRAGAVMEYLVTKSGVDAARLSSAGYGRSRPVADNKTTGGRALNRRVEFKLKYF